VSGTVLVRGIRVVDLDGQSPARTAEVLIEDGIITAVGPDLRRPGGVAVIDGGGRWAIPGLWDAHVHATQWVRSARMIPLAGANRAEDVIQRVVARLRSGVGEGRAVFGFGYRSAGWPRPGSVAELDAISGGRPVVLISGDAHNGWLNSAALRLLGAPSRSGPVSENEWFDLARRLDELPEPALAPSDFREPVAALCARGITGLVDFEFENSFLDWPERLAAGAGGIRVRTATYPHQLDQVIEAGMRSGDPLPGGFGLAVMGALKIISDGSLGSRTAWTHEPYSDGPASPEQPCGQANYSVGELTEMLRRARAAGLEVALHAIGDRANATAVTAFAVTGARGSIEHAQLIDQVDVERMASLHLRASVQPAHLLDDRDITERLWGERSARSFPLRSMLDAGVELRLGSDAPVAELDPWLAMAAAVHRSGDARPGWHPEQSITPREALAASVDGRRLAVGSPGDLVLLDSDPVAPSARDSDQAAKSLKGMAVALTVCDGTVTHDAG